MEIFRNMRVLHIALDTTMGGIEAFLLNVYRLIDREKVQFDFIEYGEYERDFNDKFTQLGANIYKLPDREKNPILAQKKLEEILKEGNYHVVHIHKNSLADASSIKVCEKLEIPKIIVHSHNASRDSKLIVLLHKINQRRLRLDRVYKFSCSTKAAEWMFGSVKNVTIINNGIDTCKFDYNPATREKVRSALNLKNAVVLGCVGRLAEQKNPLFMLDILKQLADDNIRLLWVGDGALRAEMERKTKEYALESRVIFTGNVRNPEEYYQAMDIFVMTSLYEGFPIAAVEAQCSGLPMVLSTRITEEADITGCVEWVDGDDISNWVNAILKAQEKTDDRRSNTIELQRKGYDMKTTVEFLQEFYLNENE